MSSSIFLPIDGSSFPCSFRSTWIAKPAAAASLESISTSNESSKPARAGKLRNAMRAGAEGGRAGARARITSAPSCTATVRSLSAWKRSASASGREKSSQKS